MAELFEEAGALERERETTATMAATTTHTPQAEEELYSIMARPPAPPGVAAAIAGERTREEHDPALYGRAEGWGGRTQGEAEAFCWGEGRALCPYEA